MLVNYLFDGGFLMWVILVFGLLASSIFIERLLYFFNTYIHFPNLYSPDKKMTTSEALYQQLKAASQQQSWLSFLFSHLPFFTLWQEFRLHHSPYYKIASAYIKHLNSSEKSRNAAVERQGSEIIAQMERHLSGLPIIASVSPLLGLLGTIIGMIYAFQSIELSAGQAANHELAGGLWIAMLTTTFGLLVSIPTHLAYGFLHSLVNTRIRQMNAVIQYLEEYR